MARYAGRPRPGMCPDIGREEWRDGRAARRSGAALALISSPISRPPASSARRSTSNGPPCWRIYGNCHGTRLPPFTAPLTTALPPPYSMQHLSELPGWQQWRGIFRAVPIPSGWLKEHRSPHISSHAAISPGKTSTKPTIHPSCWISTRGTVGELGR